MGLEELFGATGHTSWGQECARAIVIFVYGLAVVRTAGRRVFGQWSALDIVVAIVTGSSLSRALTGNADLFGTLAATTLMVALHWAVAQCCARWPSVSMALEGRAAVLAQDGVVSDAMLQRHGVSLTNLHAALHAAGLAHANEAARILLEPNGNIVVMRR